MTIQGITFFLLSSFVFLIWYGGRSKPLTESETEGLLIRIKKTQNIDEDSHLINDLRGLCKNDDGRSFYMVNLMKFKTEYNEQLQMTSLEAHKVYSKGIVKELFKRAGHPVMISKVIGSFIKDGDSDWDDVSIIRYRSRRDMLKMILNISNPELGKYKWASLERTVVFPTKKVMNITNIRIKVLLLLLVIGMLL